MPMQQKREALRDSYDLFHRDLKRREVAELGKLDVELKQHMRITRGGYLYKKVIKMLGSRKTHKNVLDIGCGRGYTLRLLSAGWHGGKFVGMDFSRDAVFTSKERNPSIDFVIGDAKNLPFKDDSFDIVTMVETLEHIPDTERVLNGASRVLRWRGTLLLSVPNSMCIFSRLADFIIYHFINKNYLKRNETTIFPYSFPRYMHLSDQPVDGWFSPAEIKAMLRMHNFKINSHDGWPLFPQIGFLFPFYTINIIVEKLPFLLRRFSFTPYLSIHSMWNCEKCQSLNLS